MPTKQDIALIAHLMRRAGFGEPRADLVARADKGYEAVVEELLHPEDQPPIDEELMYRILPGYEGALGPPISQADWMFRMVNTQRPLEEKIALFWHQMFATSNSKVDNPPEIGRQIAMFREYGLGKYGELLVELAKSPAMIFWLDNHGNHDGSINENWGRELLELFSLGVGNYTEDDIQSAARAFTGWTIAPKIPRNPLGRFFWNFEYKPEDHDDEEKTFLGHTGNLNGEDIMGIIVDQPASPRFLARHLYRFFVADEPDVSSWNSIPPNDPAAIEILVDAYNESHGDIRAILRVLFNSDFFKTSQFARVKSSAELIVGTVRMAGTGTAQPAQRGRLAHWRGLDRRWCIDAPCQFRGGCPGRYFPPWCPSNRRPGPVATEQLGTNHGCRLPRLHGAAAGQRHNLERTTQPRPKWRGLGLEHARRDQLLRR